MEFDKSRMYTVVNTDEVYTLTFEDLAEAYTYLDGSPCGIKE